MLTGNVGSLSHISTLTVGAGRLEAPRLSRSNYQHCIIQMHYLTRKIKLSIFSVQNAHRFIKPRRFSRLRIEQNLRLVGFMSNHGAYLLLGSKTNLVKVNYYVDS